MQSTRLTKLYSCWPLMIIVLILVALSPQQAESETQIPLIKIEPKKPNPQIIIAVVPHEAPIMAPIEIYTDGGGGSGGSSEIPKKGKSWSLFLICNPVWLLKENQTNLQNLYIQFQAFGRAIGPDHLALWFWKKAPSDETQALGDFLDEDRHNKYCTKFGLLPSKSPHVLVTTTHPDNTGAAAGDKAILELNGTTPTDIQILLLKLTDQLVVQGLQQADLDSKAYWSAWRGSLESTYAVLASLLTRVKFTVDVKFFKVEIGGEPK